MTGVSVKPTREHFVELAATYSVVPVWREVMADLETPVSTFAKLVGNGYGFLLETVEHGRWGRYSFVGLDPVCEYVKSDAASPTIEVRGAQPCAVPTDQGMLAVLDSLLEHLQSPADTELPPLHGGVVGYLGYDVVREIEQLPDIPRDDTGHPAAVMAVIGRIAAFDHWRQRLYLIDNVVVGYPRGAAGAADDLPGGAPGAPGAPDDPGAPDGPAGVAARLATLNAAYDAAIERIDELVVRLGQPLTYQPPPPPTAADVAIVNRIGENGVVESELESAIGVRQQTSSAQYAEMVEIAREYILAGDIFQVVLAQRFDIDLGADALDVYRSLRQINPSPYMYLLRFPEITVIGSSPEPMVQVRGDTVISRPIAGTRRRGRTDIEDRHLAAELVEHPKERAEHVMLVDLARNDVGRVATFGSVHATELFTLERYSHVMHLTSEVQGTLAAGMSCVDVLRATLPAGTVSGAPKIRAMEIIDELESTRRGGYAGVVGYLDFSGNLDTAIAIRTMFVTADGHASVQAGAGIVVDSDAASEDLECHNKAAALLAAIPGARALHERGSVTAITTAAARPERR